MPSIRARSLGDHGQSWVRAVALPAIASALSLASALSVAFSANASTIQPSARIVGGIYRGVIGDSIAVQLHLSHADTTLLGTLVRPEFDDSLFLRGRLDPDGSFLLREGKKGGLAITARGHGRVHEDGLSARWQLGEEAEAIIELDRYAEIHSRRHPALEVELSYPRLVSTSDPSREALNARIVDAAEDAFAERVAILEGLAAEYAHADTSRVDWLYGATQITLEGYAEGIASLLLRHTESDGDTPHAWVTTLNLAMRDGEPRVLRLRELGRPGSEFLARLSSYCLHDLERQGSSRVLDGSFSVMSEALEDWTLTANGIAFHFAPELVDDDAALPYRVEVPWSEIDSLLQPGTPVRRLRGAGIAPLP